MLFRSSAPPPPPIPTWNLTRKSRSPAAFAGAGLPAPAPPPTADANRPLWRLIPDMCMPRPAPPGRGESLTRIAHQRAPCSARQLARWFGQSERWHSGVVKKDRVSGVAGTHAQGKRLTWRAVRYGLALRAAFGRRPSANCAPHVAVELPNGVVVQRAYGEEHGRLELLFARIAVHGEVRRQEPCVEFQELEDEPLLDRGRPRAEHLLLSGRGVQFGRVRDGPGRDPFDAFQRGVPLLERTIENDERRSVRIHFADRYHLREIGRAHV